jgi:hypothetical protein
METKQIINGPYVVLKHGDQTNQDAIKFLANYLCRMLEYTMQSTYVMHPAQVGLAEVQ